MQTIQSGYRAFNMLMTLNWDRVMVLGAIGAALLAAAKLASL